MSCKKKLSYRSWHRGTKEMDLTLGLFFDYNKDKFTKEDLTCFEEFLDCDDDLLYNWIYINNQKIPQKFLTITMLIKDYHRIRNENDFG